MENYRYQGNLYGAGLSYGYQWLLSNRWSMEAVIGADGRIWTMINIRAHRAVRFRRAKRKTISE